MQNYRMKNRDSFQIDIVQPRTPTFVHLHCVNRGTNFGAALDSRNYYVIRYYAGRTTVSDPTLLVLASLAESDKHGYAIMEDIRQFAGIRLGPGTLYGAITRLEERGWIRPVQSARPAAALYPHCLRT